MKLSNFQKFILILLASVILFEVAALFAFHFTQNHETINILLPKYAVIPATYIQSSQIDFDLDTSQQIFKTLNPGTLTSKSVLVEELNSNRILYTKNSDQKEYIASITKLITAITAHSNFTNDRVIRTDSVSTSVGDSNVQLPNNTDYTIKDLLYALLMPSSNEAAYAFGNNLGYANFIDKMNLVGNAIGLKNSHFINPAGFDDKEKIGDKQLTNESTAEDVAAFTKYFLKYDLFRDIAATKQKTIYSTDGKSINLLSTNELLDVVPGVTGVKTGTENLAGQCVVITYAKDGNNFLIILLHSNDRFKEARQIIDALNTI